MATNDVYALSLRSTYQGQQCVNRLAFRWDAAGDPTATEFQGLAVAFANVMNNIQCDDLAYQDWQALKLYNSGVTYNTSPPFRVSTISYTGTYGSALTGNSTSPPLPGNIAIVIALNTDLAGRRYRGRIYLPGIPQGAIAVDGATLLDAERATQQAAWDTLVAVYKEGGTSAEWTWGVWSDRIATNAAYVHTVNGPVLTSQGAPNPAAAFRGIQSVTVRDYVGSQRDRRAGL